METLYLVADESGAKQRATKSETYSGELGVMAGLLLIGEEAACIEKKLDSIAANYSTSSKLHITDLAPSAQNSLREEIFSVLLDESVPCVYEAISSQGFHEADVEVKQLEDEAKKKARSNVSVSGKHSIDTLHRQLFEGLYAKAVAYGLDNIGEAFELKSIVDPVDKAVLKEFRKTVADFLGKPDTTIGVTGFDHDEGQVVRGAIGFKVTGLGELDQITSSVELGNGSLVLASDVLANSLLHHLESQASANEGLNSPTAVEGHPLQKLFFGISSNDLSDAFFGVKGCGEEDDGDV